MNWSLSTVVLPHRRWAEGSREEWVRAEELGFDTAYTYDHLTWRSFRGGPWFGAVPTLAAAAGATSRIRLGTLVTSPNFRHPVTLAKDLMSLDDLSGGRLTVGIGAGGTGFDATALGQEPWSPRERGARFEELVEHLDRLLTEPEVTLEGTYYAAHAAENLPGCVQHPRAPFAIAATGPRGLALAARLVEVAERVELLVHMLHHAVGDHPRPVLAGVVVDATCGPRAPVRTFALPRRPWPSLSSACHATQPPLASKSTSAPRAARNSGRRLPVDLQQPT